MAIGFVALSARIGRGLDRSGRFAGGTPLDESDHGEDAGHCGDLQEAQAFAVELAHRNATDGSCT